MTDIIDVEAFIREKAALKWSKRMVHLALKISASTLDNMLEYMPDVTFPGRHGGIGRAVYHARTAHPALANLSLCGVPGTLTELYRAWGEYIPVSHGAVKERLKAGQSVYDAFFIKPSLGGRKKR